MMEAAGMEESPKHKRCIMFWCWENCVYGGEGEKTLLEDLGGYSTLSD